MKLNRKTYSRNRSYLSVLDYSLFLIPTLMLGFLIIFYFNILFQHLNFQGVRSLKAENYSLALKFFSRVVEEQPLNPFSHLNLALAYDLNKQPVKALQVYKTASLQFNDPSQFFAAFNQAELNGRLGFLDKALKNYQAALEFQHKEKEIKENIEMLFQKKKDDKKKKEDEKKKDDKKKKEDEKKKDQQSQGEGDKNKESEKENKEGQKEESEKENNNVEKESKNEENSGDEKQEAGELSKEQEQAILKAIEQQEGKARAKAFQKKNRYGDKTGKDW